MSLVDASEILAWMNDPNPSKHEATMEELCDDVVSQLEDQMRRTLVKVFKTIIVDGRESPYLVLPDLITQTTATATVAAPTFRSRFGPSDEWEDEADDIFEYQTMPRRGMVTKVTRTDGADWCEGDNTTEVTAQFGYTSSTLPGALRRLIMEKCAAQFRDRVRISARAGLDDTTQDSPLSESSARTLALWTVPDVEHNRGWLRRAIRV